MPMPHARTAAVAPPEGPNWDELQVGLTVGPLIYTITPDMVTDFCAALAVDPAPYLADAAMPPTLLATDYIPLLHGKLELGWGLMARHSLKILRPVKVGDTVTVTGEVTDKYVRKGRHYWTLRYLVRNSAGETCLENLISCSVD
jgi:acyl dehydratase